MMTGETIRKTACATLLGICSIHAYHQAVVPPYRREEHAEEKEAVKAQDIGVNQIVTLVTSGHQQQGYPVW